jgi:hypothetical protein
MLTIKNKMRNHLILPEYTQILYHYFSLLVELDGATLQKKKPSCIT